MKLANYFVAIAALLAIGAIEKRNGKIEIPAGDIPNKALILGKLEIPVGRLVKIHGTKSKRGPDPNCFVVEEIDGKKVVLLEGETIMYVSCRQIRDWPEGTKATISGREEGLLRYQNKHDGNFDDNDPRFKPAQKVFLSFRAETVVEPKELRLAE